mmetsp:Transcript_27403/g.93546  ORF Transcript_27403/g.93546 Transcript_27403/m.93546 type:complete len:214 (-) Transcript_27403:31-672(-)
MSTASGSRSARCGRAPGPRTRHWTRWSRRGSRGASRRRCRGPCGPPRLRACRWTRPPGPRLGRCSRRSGAAGCAPRTCAAPACAGLVRRPDAGARRAPHASLLGAEAERLAVVAPGLAPVRPALGTRARRGAAVGALLGARCTPAGRPVAAGALGALAPHGAAVGAAVAGAVGDRLVSLVSCTASALVALARGLAAVWAAVALAVYRRRHGAR